MDACWSSPVLLVSRCRCCQRDKEITAGKRQIRSFPVIQGYVCAIKIVNQLTNMHEAETNVLPMKSHVMHLSIFCPGGGLHGALDRTSLQLQLYTAKSQYWLHKAGRRPFLTGGNIHDKLMESGSRIIDFGRCIWCTKQAQGWGIGQKWLSLGWGFRLQTF